MADIIDTRDLHDRYNELQVKIEKAQEDWDEGADYDHEPEAADVLDADEMKDWIELSEMEDQISDFWFGETLVNEDYFTDYAAQLAEDLGYINRSIEGSEWPFNHIDWEAAADVLRDDYTEFEWQGETYLARA